MVKAQLLQMLFTFLDNLATQLFLMLKKAVATAIDKKMAHVNAEQERFELQIHDAMSEREKEIQRVKDEHDKKVDTLAKKSGAKLTKLNDHLDKLSGMTK